MMYRYEKRFWIFKGDEVKRGFSLIEMLIVVSLLAILAAIAIPSFTQWRGSLPYKEASRAIMSGFREARTKAISTNREHRVEIDVVSKRYRIWRSTRSAGSVDADYTTVAKDWFELSSVVTISTNLACNCFNFNPRGTAGAGNVEIKNSAGTTQYKVLLTSMGRVRITRGGD